MKYMFVLMLIFCFLWDPFDIMRPNSFFSCYPTSSCFTETVRRSGEMAAETTQIKYHRVLQPFASPLCAVC